MDDPPVGQQSQPDNADFGPTTGVGDGYPEEAPREAVPEGSDPDHRFAQKGKEREEG